MALILNIDTADQLASIGLAQEGSVIGILENADQKDHASWLHVAVRKLLEEAGRSLSQLDAIAITAGPGSYTGLRVGMAAAKGLCFALDIPLIMENTLKVMALAGLEHKKGNSDILICPMIDARRMEVFTAVYDSSLRELMAPAALILEPNSFEAFLKNQELLFLGSGSEKWKSITNSHNVRFLPSPSLAPFLSAISFQKFKGAEFTDIIYAEPVYIKEFHTHVKK
jgi:tRNA threonylcarbamoyladenosine biosynthesis protein TsaB